MWLRPSAETITASPTLLCSLGRMDYREAWDLQAEIQAALIGTKRATPPARLPHVLLLVEHPPVFTLGKSGDPANLLATERGLAERGATFVATDRGGDITFHGPGQIVAYPVLDLDRLTTPEGESLRDLHRFLRQMEEAVIRTCADWGVVADRVPGRTGVWVGPDARGDERKVCAMGVRCSRWVSMHGLALNVTTSLDWFDLIVPCGIDDRGVTSLARESSRSATWQEVADALTGHLETCLGLRLQTASRAEIDALFVTKKISPPTASP